jgi:hypothetical protein
MICAVIQHPWHCVKYHGTNAATCLGNHAINEREQRRIRWSESVIFNCFFPSLSLRTEAEG